TRVAPAGTGVEAAGPIVVIRPSSTTTDWLATTRSLSIGITLTSTNTVDRAARGVATASSIRARRIMGPPGRRVGIGALRGSAVKGFRRWEKGETPFSLLPSHFLLVLPHRPALGQRRVEMLGRSDRVLERFPLLEEELLV